MASWSQRFTALLGGKKPAERTKAKASKGANKNARAQLIENALSLHRDHGAPLRAALNKAVKGLEDRRTLRDPEALARLLALAQAQRAMQRLFSGDLRRYLVLAGLRQWTGKEPAPPSDKILERSRNTVTRR